MYLVWPRGIREGKLIGSRIRPLNGRDARSVVNRAVGQRRMSAQVKK